jgi:hypothetical protein
MHPYRDAPMPANRPTRPDPEELIMYSLFIVIGTIPVAIAVIRGAAFGFAATLGLLMVILGLTGLLVRFARARTRQTR